MTENEAMDAVNKAIQDRERGASAAATNERIQGVLNAMPNGKIKRILAKTVVS